MEHRVTCSAPLNAIETRPESIAILKLVHFDPILVSGNRRKFTITRIFMIIHIFKNVIKNNLVERLFHMSNIIETTMLLTFFFFLSHCIALHILPDMYYLCHTILLRYNSIFQINCSSLRKFCKSLRLQEITVITKRHNYHSTLLGLFLIELYHRCPRFSRKMFRS